MRLNYAIVFVSDMQRSLAFYHDLLGLSLKFASTHWTEFSTEGATLALHLSERSGQDRPDSQPEPAGRCRPGLSVPDLDAFHRRMVGNQVPCVQEPKEVFGSLIAQYLDPDGLVISVAQERGGRPA